MLKIVQVVADVTLANVKVGFAFPNLLLVYPHQIQKSQQRNNRPNQGTRTKSLFDSLNFDKVLRYKIQQRNKKPSKPMTNSLLTS